MSTTPGHPAPAGPSADPSAGLSAGAGLLAHQALDVLRADDRGGYTIPSGDLYPFQWLWDAAFASLGWLLVSEERAWQELRSLLGAQWENGFVPHIVFHRPDPNYFPGPDVWETGTNPPTSGLTQPPVLATAALYLYRHARDRALARAAALELLPRILAYHRWLYRARDPERTGLVSILHPWESGMDNSPAWDEPLGRVPPTDLSPERRKDTSRVPASHRPTHEEYRRYLALIYRFRDAGYDERRLYFESPFRVVDVGFNALLHRANQDLLALATELGTGASSSEPARPEPARPGPAPLPDAPPGEAASEIEAWIQRGAQAFGRLWDDEASFYLSWDAIQRAPLRVTTSGGFLPLFAGLAGAGEAGRLVSHLVRWGERARYLVPSVAPSYPGFDPCRYWRGPVWPHVNWIIADGLSRYGYPDLARRLRADTLELVSLSGFREYYHPQTGEGLGGRQFAWSAAITLVWGQDPAGGHAQRVPGDLLKP